MWNNISRSWVLKNFKQTEKDSENTEAANEKGDGGVTKAKQKPAESNATLTENIVNEHSYKVVIILFSAIYFY